MTLAKHIETLLKSPVANSYYNDEYDVSCKTTDLDKVYDAILETKNSEELKEQVEIEGKKYDFQAALKITLVGDKGSQLSNECDTIKRLKAILHIYDLAKTDPALEKILWESTVGEGTKEDYKAPWPERNNKKPLSQLIAMGLDRIDLAYTKDYSVKQKELVLQLAIKICKLFKKFKNFSSTLEEEFNEGPFVEEELKSSLKPAVAKNIISDAAMKIAKKDYSPLYKPSASHMMDHRMRPHIYRYLFTGKSGDKDFDTMIAEAKKEPHLPS